MFSSNEKLSKQLKKKALRMERGAFLLSIIIHQNLEYLQIKVYHNKDSNKLLEWGSINETEEKTQKKTNENYSMV